jgi:hypothetical protein
MSQIGLESSTEKSLTKVTGRSKGTDAVFFEDESKA